MSRDEIISMARDVWTLDIELLGICNLEAFAALIEARAVARTREECAALCDVTPPYPFRPSIEAAHAIRAMGERT